MRVRYGKPIKVKSMLSNSLSRDISNGGSYALVYKNWGTGADVEFRAFTEADYSHKFFCYTEFELATNNFTHTGFAAQGTSESTYKPNNYSLCSINKPTANAVSLYVYGTLQSPITVKTRFMIDLTEIGLDNLTAQQFYNKYNKYFPLIATGEEITLDDKSASASLGPRLPLEYQEVEYIESSGTQYIDTGFKPNQDTTMSIDFQLNSISTTQGIFGIGDSSINKTYRIGVSSNGYFYVALKTNQYNGSSGTSNTNRNIFEIKNHYLYLNGNQYAQIIDTSAFSCESNAYIFYFGGSTTITKASGKLYSCKIYDNNILVRSFIPCYRKSDNVIGMYDLIGNTFFTNAGQGTFLKGNNVNNTISCKVTGGSSDIYYGYNQILNKGTFTSNGITWTLNDDLTFTLSGTTTSTYSSFGLNGILKKNHKYLNVLQILENPNNIAMGSGFFNMGQKNPKINSGFSGAISLYPYDSSYDSMGIDQYGGVGVDLTGIKIRFQIIDLTWWYGENKEPSSYNEFKEKFTKEYYGFCPTAIKLTQYQIEALPNYRYNQLVKNGNFVDSSNWSVTENTQRRPSINNNIYTIETLTQGYAVSIEQSNNAQFLYSNHKYLVHFEGKGTSSGSTTHLQASIKLYSYANSATIFNQPYQDLTNEFKDFYSIITPTQTTSGTSASGGFRIYYQSNTGLSYVGDKVQMKNIYVIDLTDWYGSGNEPATVEEFKRTFPNKYYPYSKKSLLNKYMINKLEN